MQEKIVTILVLLLILLSIGLVSGEIDNEQQELNEDLSYLDIPAPENLEVIKEDDDILVQWDAVEEVDQYKLYYSTDLYAPFPMGWKSVLLEEEQWVHNDVLNNNESYYYIVRGLSNEIEGRISETGLCARLNFTYDPDGRLHYISIPDGFNNLEEPKASDIVRHIEGGTDAEHNEFIDSVVKWDYTQRGFTQTYGHSGFGWSGDDFIIEPKATVGIQLTDNLTWHVNAVESEITMDFDFQLDEGELHYISVPYTMADLNRRGELTASDIVLDIYGDMESSGIVDRVVKWDYTTRTFNEQLYYSENPFGDDGWVGQDFLVEPEATVGLSLKDNLTWTPTLMDFEPPTVRSTEIEENIVIEFSKEMNQTSIESNLLSNTFNFTTNWINNHTLEIIPDEPLEPEIQYNLEISNRSKCICGNYLDGNSNGTAYRTDDDDYVLNFVTGTYPILEHDPPIRWHIHDNIELSANISDEEGLDKAYINYTQVNGIQHNVSLDLENSTISIPPQNESGTFSYYYYAVDENGLTNKSKTYSIDILDLSPPVIEHESPDRAHLSEDIELSVDVINDLEIETLNINYTDIENTNHNVSLDIEDTVIQIPSQNQRGNITYYFWVVDESGASNKSTTYAIDILDLTPPEIEHESPDRAHLSEDIELSMEIINDLEIENIYLNYTDVEDLNHNVSLDREDSTIIPSQDQAGTITYYYWVVDESGTSNKSSIHSIEILDLNLPVIEDVSHEESVLPIDGSFTIEFSKPMNFTSIERGITINPDLEYSLNFISENKIDVNITEAAPDEQYTVIFDSDIIKDEHGINLESDHQIHFYTETPPEIVHDQPSSSISKCSDIPLYIECIDEFGIDRVHIEYAGPNGYHFTEEMSHSENMWNITVPRLNRTGQFEYRFFAQDYSGLQTYSENYSLSILDPTEVRFVNVTGESDESIKFEVEIINHVGIREAEIYYTENGVDKTEKLRLTEGNAGNGIWTTQMDFDKEGEYDYSLVITDLDGETMVEQSNNSIIVQKSSSIFANPLLYILLISVITAAIGGILYNRRDIEENISKEDKDISEKSKEETKDETEDTEEQLCTICFDSVNENIHICECGKSYHKSCITAIGECPICGNDDVKEEGVNNGGE